MEAPQLERKLVAILAADFEGYSRHMGIDEERTLATLTAHRAITDRLIVEGGGRICGTAGDSIIAEFASVLNAAKCAVDIQRELRVANEALLAPSRMWLRIGLNVGDVMLKDGDIFGDGVNIAARLEGLADPGGICVSRGVHDHIKRKLGYSFVDLGEQVVKNIAQPIRVFRMSQEPAGTEAGDGDEAEVPRPPDPDGNLAADAVPIAADDSASVEVVFWQSVKDSVEPSDYEAYLRQYPQGSFAALARARVETTETTKENGANAADPQDRAVELAFWDSVREIGDAASMRAYVDKYPHGEFSPLAKLKLQELETGPPPRSP